MARLDSSYPGGLASYIKNARRLLADSKAGKNPYDGFTPSVSGNKSDWSEVYIWFIAGCLNNLIFSYETYAGWIFFRTFCYIIFLFILPTPHA